jgi:hypothetical protein
MSATFVCPHCGASYPRKPVLVGRAVRCTTCKNAFRLRDDGIADKIEMDAPAPAPQPAAAAPAPVAVEPPAPVPAPAPAPAAPKPSPAPAPTGKPSGPKLASSGWGLDLDVDVVEPNKPAASAPPAAARPTQPPEVMKTPLPREGESTTTAQRKSERMTAQQLEARRAMAATLSTSMSEALKSEAVKREEQGEKAKAKVEGRVGKIGPAVLTGQGVEEARSSRLILLGSVAAVVVLAAAWWLLFSASPQRAGLNAFTEEVDPARIRAGERVQAIQGRAWLIGLPPAQVGVPPLIDVRDARIRSSRAIKLDGAKEIITKLKGLVPVEPGPVWVPPERLAAVEDVRRPEQKPEAFIAAVLKKEKKAISHPAVIEELMKTGMSEDDAKVIDMFLRGRTDADGKNTIASRWMDGDLPSSVEVAAFFGMRGTMLLSRGQSFKTAEVEYDGRLVRLTGAGWPEEWKVLSIETKLKQKF